MTATVSKTDWKLNAHPEACGTAFVLVREAVDLVDKDLEEDFGVDLRG